MKSIITEPADMSEFINIVTNQLNGLRTQKSNLEEQLGKVDDLIVQHLNQLDILKNWYDIMTHGDLTLIKMAYDDLKKNMTEIKNAEPST